MKQYNIARKPSPGSTGKLKLSFRTRTRNVRRTRIIFFVSVLTVLEFSFMFLYFNAAKPKVSLAASQPVELVCFYATPLQNSVLCSWQTASEANNDSFTIEKSSDAIDFTTVATIKGAGNSSTKKNYQVMDYAPVEGLNFYRLKQTDFDGNCIYPIIKSVKFKAEMTESVIASNEVISDSVKEYFSVNYTLTRNALVTVFIMDSTGKEIYSKKRNDNKGINRFDYDARQLADGIYFVTLAVDKEIRVSKLVKNSI